MDRRPRVHRKPDPRKGAAMPRRLKSANALPPEVRGTGPREGCARNPDLRYTFTLAIVKVAIRDPEVAVKKHASRDSQPAGRSMRPRIALSASRENGLNPHRRPRRAGRGFVQPRSI